MAANPSIQLGTDGNWAIKEDNLLAYKKDGTRFFNKEFDFTRATFATRINKSGLIEKGRENLLLQSNQFDTTWFNSNTTETSGQAGYDGSNDAWRIDLTGAAGYISQSLSQAGVQTASVYAKAGTLNFFRFRITGSGGDKLVDINLTNGSIGTTGGDNIDAKAVSVGNDWYRISLTCNTTPSAFLLYPIQADSDFTATSGNIYIQDAQLEQGLVATDYIESGATTGKAGVLENLPRIDFSDSVKGALLLELQRSNLLAYSESELVFSGGATIENDFTQVSPTGYKEGVVKISNLQGSTGDRVQTNVVAITGGNTYTSSMYIKGTFGETISYQFKRNGGTFAGSIRETITFDGTWQRIESTFTSLSDNTGATMVITTQSSDTADVAYIWGAQVEEGSFSTSYIPTYGSAATRNADVCNNSGSAQDFNSEEGVLYLEAKVQSDTVFSPSCIGISDGTDANRISILMYAISDNIRSSMNVGGVSKFDIYLSGYNTGQYYKIAISYKENDCKMFINGVKVGTDTSATMPSLGTFDRLNLDIGNNSYDFHGNVREVQVFKRAMSDGELYLLTTTQYQSYQEMATALNYTL